jgi:leucyl/phenylalanyl-tRNA--protein transferase
MLYIPEINKNSIKFSNPRLANDEGLMAHGGDLSQGRIMSAYTSGIFPWFNEDDPILWWSPNPRFVLDINELHVSKSLQKTIRKEVFEIKFDTAFKEVMINCAQIKRAEEDGTWITNDMIEAYVALHESGFAHSFEAYYEGELVGGGYGVEIGNIFCGESMFFKKKDASKVAFVHLVNRLKGNGFILIDSQMHTPHLESLGAKHISRDDYLDKVKKSLTEVKDF